MSHRNHSSAHKLPANPNFISFSKSDGNSSTWPKDTTEVVDDEGNVNFMRPVPLDESISVKWRIGIADALAAHFGYPDASSRSYVLQSFPHGYAMYDHNKGKRSAPRHDIYLFGGSSRFRSVPEFIPHAIWLMGDQTSPCACKYCGKNKSQRDITKGLMQANVLPQRGSSSSPTPSPTRVPRAKTVKHPLPRAGNRLQAMLKEQPPRSVAAIQAALPDVSAHVQQKVPMLQDRFQDLRAVAELAMSTDMPRYCRDGEVVWCTLVDPISYADEMAIEYWPAVVEMSHLVQTPMTQGAISPPPRYSYTVQLLSTSRTCKVSDDGVLPYLAYGNTDEQMQAIVGRVVALWPSVDQSKLASFDPCPDSPKPPPTPDACLPSYMLALQTASRLCDFWMATDDWDAELILESPPPAASSASASAPVSKPLQIKQTRFQGLWWGGERIWVDDLVRLKLPRSCMAPRGAQHIFAPSGPGESQLQKIAERDLKGGRVNFALRGPLYELADEDWRDPNLPRADVPKAEPRKEDGPDVKPPVLPPAPGHFKFRPIVSPGYEIVVSLSLISGRYYPRLLEHPRLKKNLEINTQDTQHIDNMSHLWSLVGLAPGIHNPCDPKYHKNGREKMLKDAMKTAFKEIGSHVQKALQNAAAVEQEKEDDAMEVDGM
ncbi:Actin-related protein 8 [Mycena kentingensis (nom. inval.)]|nr:Actin-related protein 8 [Mycena kentingensis (nom. inval.)]